MKYILALDLGTTRNRAILFNRQAVAVASSYREFRQYYPQPGLVEHDPVEIWQIAKAVIREVVAKAGVSPKNIVALGITNQRETTVVWNRKTGKPLYRAIVWQDRRTAEMCARLKREGLEPLIRRKTGLLLDPYFSATKLSWLLKKLKGERKSDLCFGTVDSWILWNLTGGQVHATDPSNASRTLLFNIQSGTWDKDLLKIFYIPAFLLPEVLPSSHEFGFVRSDFFSAPVPILSICGDQQASLFGQTCFNRGDLKVTYGTGAFLVLNTGEKPVFPKEPLLATVAWQVGKKVTYALEGSVFACGGALNWLKDNLGFLRDPAEADKLAGRVRDCGGVQVVPAYSGLGAPYWKPYARGAITGLSLHTRKEHIVRATLEAIAQEVADVSDVMQGALHSKLKALRADGGVAKSDFVLQAQADFSGLPVLRSRASESTALGAAMIAGLHARFWRNQEELRGLSGIARTFLPKMTAVKRTRERAAWHCAIQKVLL